MNHSIILSLLGAWLFLSGSARAATDRTMTVKTTVDGMVCSFCAQGIVAHFKKHPAVSKVHVDLSRKLVLLEEKKGASISDKLTRATEPFTATGVTRPNGMKSGSDWARLPEAGPIILTV